MTTSQLSVASSLALGVFAIAVVASADAYDTKGHRGRSHHGSRSSAITTQERKGIAKHRHRVIRLRRQAFSDGYLTRREAKKIKKAKRRLYEHIHWARHNDKLRKHPRHTRRDSEHFQGRYNTGWYQHWW